MYESFQWFQKPLITSRKSIPHLSNAEFGFNSMIKAMVTPNLIAKTNQVYPVQ
jgi:hypothetical protein